MLLLRVAKHPKYLRLRGWTNVTRRILYIEYDTEWLGLKQDECEAVLSRRLLVTYAGWLPYQLKFRNWLGDNTLTQVLEVTEDWR